MCGAVGGEGQHAPRIPEEEIHQGASNKSIIGSNSSLSFSQILLQTLKTDRRRLITLQLQESLSSS